MTDTAFYARMDELAARLLTNFGSPATYRYTPAKPKPNGQGVVVEPAPVDKAGLAVRTESKQVLAMFDKPTTVALIVKFPIEPGVEGLIFHGGQTWKVQEVRPVKPLGTSMIVGFVSCAEA